MVPGSDVPHFYMAHNGNMAKSPMFPGCYVLKILCSQGPVFPGSYVPHFYMAHNGNMTKGPMFQGSCVPRVRVRLFDPNTIGGLMYANRILNWET